MKRNVYNQRAVVPEAFITKNKQRLKQHGEIVYLKKGDEFEVELFNPTTTKVLAKILLNGEYISYTGLILRPGERVFLERYIDDPKKFLFETYNVNSADLNVKEAIKNNGLLEVEFYDKTYNTWYTEIPPTVIKTPNIYWNPTYTSHDYNTGAGTLYTTSRTSSDISNAGYHKSASTTLEHLIETGRIEKGDYSNQNFVSDYDTFNVWYSRKVSWKILPESQKYAVKEDLVIYCTNCGAKRKKSTYKFCPHCGNKL